jgi:hypothetical protein
VGHLDGFEENTAPENLIWNSRACNTQLGALYKRLGFGRRTRQYNPGGQGAASLGQWLTVVLSAKGESDQMTVTAAVEMNRAPPERRSQFAWVVVASGKHVNRPARGGNRGRRVHGGVKVLITEPHGFDRTVTFALDDDPAIIAERVRETMEE